VPGTREHFAAILPLLSDADRAEVADLGGMWPAFDTSLRCWCGLVDGVPLFFGGVFADGVAWMIATPEVRNAKRFYLEATRRMCAEMHETFPVLRVFDDARREKPMRWLRWLGFAFAPATFDFMGREIFAAVRRRA
jgi:hypothetical protein